MTSLPTWAIWTLGFGSPALTAIITLVSQYLSRRGQAELETRSRREEILRNLRWAAELAVSDDIGKARLGMQELQALRESELLSSTEEGFIDAALRAAIEGPREAILQAGDGAEVVATSTLPASGEPVSSEAGEQEEASVDD